MQFKVIVAPTITEMFERQLQSMILSGQLVAGAKLPTEAALAEQMHISKSAVHLGIKHLERRGFLRIEPRRGVFVVDYTKTGNLETLFALLTYQDARLDPDMVASLLSFREAIEGQAMIRLAEKHTSDDIIALNDIILKIRKEKEQNECPDVDLLSELVFAFTLEICFRSGNKVYPMIINAFHDITIVFWKDWIRKVGIESVLDDLTAYVYLIRSGDGKGAVQLYRDHAQAYLNSFH